MFGISIGTIYGLLQLQGNFQQQLAQAANLVGSIGDQIERAGARATRVGSALTIALTLPLVAAGGAAVKFGMDFERTMTQLVTISGVAEKAMGEMTAQILDKADDWGKGPRELADALLVVTSTGIRDTTTAMSILEISAKASAAGLGSVKDVARSVTAAMTAYKDSNLTAAKAGDILFAAVREGGADADQFAGTLGRVVGIAAQIGVSFEEVAASIATFTRLGVGADEAVTALRGTISALLQGQPQTRDALVSLGTTLEDVRAKIKDPNIGLAGALIELVKLAKGNDEALTDIIPNVRALAGVLGTAGAQAGVYNDILRQLKFTHNDLSDGFERNATTMAFRWDQLRARVEVLAIMTGGRLAESLHKLIDAAMPLLDIVEQMVKGFTALPEPIQTTTLAFLGLTIVIGPIVGWFGRILEVIGMIVGSRGFAALFPMLRTLGTLFSGLVLGIGGFTAALAAIVVPVAIVALLRALKETAGLLDDIQKRQAGMAAEAAVHAKMLAEASRVAGRAITDIDEGETLKALKALYILFFLIKLKTLEAI